jgi:hypothetical protein
MLSLIKTAKVKSASGDVNTFLKRILIEVVAENYKQMLYENLANTEGLSPLDPPIRANERIMSGLFGNAISVVADRSRPEARIDRDETQANPEIESPKSKAGRVDYLAWYGKRTFAIELKMSYMDCTSSALRKKVKKPWTTLVKQTLDAQNCLLKRNEDDPARYPDPISIGLMVVVGKHALSKNITQADLDQKLDDHLQEFKSSLLNLSVIDGQDEEIDPDTAPEFVATYIFPEDFRSQARRKKGVATNAEVYIPFIAFVACIKV